MPKPLTVVLGVAAVASIGAALWVVESRGLWSMLKTESQRREASQQGLERGKEVAEREVLAPLDSALGAPVFLRIFKESSELELWVQPEGAATFELAATWAVARWSGELGPKQQEGDRQAPEGFYYTDSGSLNPNSSYHLSFNINYPNAYDRSLGRTGSWIMVHGGKSSIGCFAMTDPVIEVIYGAVEEALKNGQEAVPVHVFPFRMTEERLADVAEDHPWRAFWLDELLPEYQRFEKERSDPKVLGSEVSR